MFINPNKLKKPKRVFWRLAEPLLSRLISDDKLYVRMKWWGMMPYDLHLDNPLTFNEKLQWLKLFDHNSIYTTVVDKNAVKQYVADIIGEEYIIPTLGVWDNADDIDFDKLPIQFVLKTTHSGGSTGVVICKDKTDFDKVDACNRLSKSLSFDFYRSNREWPYKDVPRKIIAEQFMSDDSPENRGGLTDYKFYCFNGKPYKVMLCLDRNTGDTKFYSFDRDWNLLRHNKRGLAAPEGFTLPKPAKIDEMFDIAGRLSQDIPFARVDLYFVHGQVFFGELTLYPDSGLDPNILPEIDKLYGSMIELPTSNNTTK